MRPLAVAFALAGILNGCPTPYEMNFRGPLPARQIYADLPYEGHVVELSVFWPDATPPEEGFPLIVFSTGWNQPRGHYTGYGTQLAEWGYVTVIRHYPSPTVVGGVQFEAHVRQNAMVIAWCAEETIDPESELFGMADTSNVAMVGHSFGAGVAAVSALEGVRAAVILDMPDNMVDYVPLETLGDCPAAFMHLVAGHEGVIWGGHNDDLALFDHSPPPAAEITIVGADHMDFMEGIVGLNHIGIWFGPHGTADSQVVRDITIRYMIAWLNVHMKGQDEFADWYQGERAQQDVDAGLLEIRTK